MAWLSRLIAWWTTHRRRAALHRAFERPPLRPARRGALAGGLRDDESGAPEGAWPPRRIA